MLFYPVEEWHWAAWIKIPTVSMRLAIILCCLIFVYFIWRRCGRGCENRRDDLPEHPGLHQVALGSLAHGSQHARFSVHPEFLEDSFHDAIDIQSFAKIVRGLRIGCPATQDAGGHVGQFELVGHVNRKGYGDSRGRGDGDREVEFRYELTVFRPVERRPLPPRLDLRLVRLVLAHQVIQATQLRREAIYFFLKLGMR